MPRPFSFWGEPMLLTLFRVARQQRLRACSVVGSTDNTTRADARRKGGRSSAQCRYWKPSPVTARFCVVECGTNERVTLAARMSHKDLQNIRRASLDTTSGGVNFALDWRASVRKAHRRFLLSTNSSSRPGGGAITSSSQWLPTSSSRKPACRRGNSLRSV
jgi:hypothetical protein